MGDEHYLRHPDEALARVRESFELQIIVYVAGSDPYERDPLGSLLLTKPRFSNVIGAWRGSRWQAAALWSRCPVGGYSDESPAITAAGFSAIVEIERSK